MKSTENNKYKEDTKKGLYKNYFTKLHESEKYLEFTSTKIVNYDIVKYFKKNNKNNILDAGCGDGTFLKVAKKEGVRCEGFDNNEEFINLLKKDNFKTKYGDFSDKLPYSDNSFDGIYCSNVFEHLEEPEFALYELLRILKKDGILIITVPEFDNLFYSDWTHIKPFTRQTFDNILKCVEYKSYKIRKRHFPVIVRYWKNPIIKFGNLTIKKGIFAIIFTYLFERIFKIRRHDLILEVRK